jgi:probable HAF family extracellular repeat protein
MRSVQQSQALSIFLAVMALIVNADGQSLSSSQGANPHPPRYRLVDLGTFGGPASYFSNGFDGILNNHGTAVGWANTSTPDPVCFVAPNCFATHAFQARDGVIADLGVLDGGLDSAALWISPNGLITGYSQNGEIDPLLPSFPEVRAVLWRNGELIDLGTLPQGGFESLANSVNNRGQVVGLALNTVPDTCSLVGFPTQTRAFIWQGGTMEDLGTLGGPDADAELINEAGQVIGTAATTTLGPDGCAIVHPYFWENGTMQDIGTLGGTQFELRSLNQRGQVVGVSFLAGNQPFHPFLWDKGVLTDLGTLGGANGEASWINDRGDIVGKADLPGSPPQAHDAVLWKRGQKNDLGVLPGDSCSNAYFVNSHGQIVGTSETFEFCTLSPEPVGQHAFVREPGGMMENLNTLIPAGASLDLAYAVAINDRGEIAGFGVPPDCAPQDVFLCGHSYVLIPCGVGEECLNTAPGAAAPFLFDLKRALPQTGPANLLERFKNKNRQKSHLPQG